MFIQFSENKAHYEKGQVFPFLIAIIAIIIMMAMITANLGKVAIFKTDVSNAADSGALAAASVLSGTLLGFGLASDTECGKSVISTARIVEIAVLGRDDINITVLMDSIGASGSSSSETTTNSETGGYTTTTHDTDSGNNATTTTTEYDSDGNQTSSTTTDDDRGDSYQNFGQDLIGMVKIYIQRIISYLPDYIKAMLDGQMAWANAKQTALKYAFQNAGIDEQVPVEFKNYTGGSYDDYINTFLAQEENQSGFSRFMEHTLSGYWNNNGVGLDAVEPKMDLPPFTITSGYGWSQEADESFTSSYPGNDYKVKDNYVEVQVQGSLMYPVEPLYFAEYFGPGVVNTLTGIVGVGSYLKYIGCFGEGDETVMALKNVYGLGYLLAALYCIITAAAFRGMIEYMPVGFTFTDRDMAKYTTDNPVKVQVIRHKKDNNMGLWNFQYGDIIAKSAGHAFQQTPSEGGYSASDITIEPVLIEGMKDLGNFLGDYSGIISADSWEAPVTLVRGLLCMGAAMTMGGLMATAMGDTLDELEQEYLDAECDDLDDCPEYWVKLNVFLEASGMLPFMLPFILDYLIYSLLCDTEDSYQPEEGQASFNEDAISNEEDPNAWFTTSLHLFETELVPGYLQ